MTRKPYWKKTRMAQSRTPAWAFITGPSIRGGELLGYVKRGSTSTLTKKGILPNLYAYLHEEEGGLYLGSTTSLTEAKGFVERALGRGSFLKGVD